MKNRWTSGLLAMALLASVPMTALAAENRQPVISPTPSLISQEVQTFSDVSNDHWAASQIRQMTDLGVMTPDGEGRFSPDRAVTRAEVVDALWRLSGKPVVNYLMTFKDVQQGSETAEAIRWAAAEKISGGYSADWFGAADTVTREQLATILYRYVQKFDMGFKGMWMFPLNYTDVADMAEWASEPVHWMVANHLMQGKGECLLPKGTLTRAQEAVMLSRLLDVAAKKDVHFENYSSRGDVTQQ